ncbi:MAG: hypothetical protein H6721_01895 [Sandaracinus sp.]|nr:hypothetical protein [Sandaracinus sp.]MCB9611179.1 hypothetical protein [Sandaracinus sp.]MCB9623734.1 hypothetical protein [Sandaracinus sp.]MCB9630895.1 hypothetical protein [Sandaracinus sp.]
MTPGTGARTRRLLAAVALLALATAGVLAHALTRHANLDARRAAVRFVGFADLALSSSARWIRHPSQVEPGAPFQDGPASLDTDPAGAVVGPPLEAR